jgi:hypothetical protein
MATRSTSSLETTLMDVLMAELAPCDLGKGIEVIHDVEAVEIEMDCEIEIDDDGPDDIASTMRFARPPEELGNTHQYARYSAPYERIELAIDPQAYVRATIEEAKTLLRSRKRS